MAQNDMALAFVGSAEIHSANSRALLKDLIKAHKRQNSNGKVYFIFPLDNVSPTMDDLMDFCLTSGHELELVGKPEDLRSEELAEYVAQASQTFEAFHPVKNIVEYILPEHQNARLILVADPNEDDEAYNAVVWATEAGVPVRSLLKGLDTVLFDEQEQEESVARDEEWDEEETEDEDEESEDEEYDEEEEEESDDESDEDEEEDEETDEFEEEDVEDEYEESDDEEEEEEESDEADDDFEDEAEDEESDEEYDDVEDDADDVEEEEEEEAPVAAAKTKMTESQLNRLYEKDYDEFLAYAKKFKVLPGRGRRQSTLVNEILAATGQTPKSAPAPKKATTARKPAAKKPAAKKPGRRPAATTTKRPARAAARAAATATAPAAANGKVDKTVARALIKTLKQTADLLESLV